MKYSVIIPVYNAEKFLEECVKSFLRQTYREFEILLIDDESSDSSSQLCDRLAEEDRRVKAFHKKNGGTSDTRNYGLKRAAGDYIIFMDNDDWWIDVQALEIINQQLTESGADVLLFDKISYWGKDEKYCYSLKNCKREEVVNRSRSESISALLEKGLFYRAVWTKVVKRELIEKNDIYFKKGIRNEDTDWTAKMLIYARSYDWFEKPLYVYRKGESNAQTSGTLKYTMLKDLKNIVDEYVNVIQEAKLEPEFESVLYDYLAYPYAVWLAQAGMFHTDEKKKDMRQMKKYSFLLKYDKDPYVKTIYKIYKIFGFRLTVWVLQMYLKYRTGLKTYKWTKKY